MNKIAGIVVVILIAGGIYLGWRGYLNEKRFEKNFTYTSLLIDSLKAGLDSLKVKRIEIRSLTKSIEQREKERKHEALNLSSIDSLACLANKLLAGKGN